MKKKNAARQQIFRKCPTKTTKIISNKIAITEKSSYTARDCLDVKYLLQFPNYLYYGRINEEINEIRI